MFERLTHCALLVVLCVGATNADFVAYNDHERGDGTHPNTTNYQANATASGPLRDIVTGEDLAVVLTTSGVGVGYAQMTDWPAAGTDAGDAFLGYVDFAPGRPHSLELAGEDVYIHEFSNMDPARRYDFTGTAVRGVETYTGRWSLVTLDGADSFVPAHSTGAGVVTEGLNANQVAIWTGANHRADEGFVARWKEIDPGADGRIRVVSQHYLGPIPGGYPTDSKGYGLVAVRLIEEVVEGRPEVQNQPATAVTAHTATIGGSVVDPGVDTPEITLYFGPEDGGRNPDAWAGSVALGTQTGAFSHGLTGLNPGTAYYYRSYARNSVAGAWAADSATFTTGVVPPTIEVLGMESTTALTAVVLGNISDAGGEPPEVTVYWGQTDGGTNAGAWDAGTPIGVQSDQFSIELTGLEPLTPYYFTFFAANAAGGAWAAGSGTFETEALLPPQVLLRPITSRSDRSATITGEVLDDGGDPPFVELFFGPSDGGTDPDAWLGRLSLGTVAGAFSGVVSPLEPQTYYFARLHASNLAGEQWSDPQWFQTLEELLVSVVINELHYNTVDPTDQAEFIELYNASEAPIELQGWRLSGAVDYTFGVQRTLQPGDYLIVAEGIADFEALFGLTPYAAWETGDRLSNEGESVTLRNNLDEVVDEVTYKSGFPWPTGANGTGASMELIHPLMDNDLGGAWRSSIGAPTPGRQNSVYSEQAPPLLRQVSHAPAQPTSTDAVTITVKATDSDGIGEVYLEYQVVHPGAYIEIGTTAYNTQWTRVAMGDEGSAGDAVWGDDVFSARLPADLFGHRDLVRYRITASDALGNSVGVPYPDDEQPNFAFFVYDGLPAWTASARPGVTSPVTYPPELLGSVPVIHLITTRKSHEDAMSIPNSTAGGYWGSDYPWRGTLVYNGEVYDHVRFRARGGVWRYSMGKNMWKFDFLRSHDFQAHDDYGRPYDTLWKKLNFSALIQQGDFLQRGEQGLFEGAGFKLHNLADNAAPKTHYMHFRIVEQADESGGGDQYNTDFQGLYMAIEQPDGRFLQEHNLPDGNFYKMEGGTGELNNQGPTQPTDKSDLNAFLTYQTQTKTADWWRSNLDLDQYYSWRSIMEAIHDYDNHAGKNYFFFHNPESSRWSVINWDLDLTWTTTYGGGGGRGPLNDYVFTHPEFAMAYRNRMREIRDLLFNSEQTGILLDEIAQVVFTPGFGVSSFVDADRAMWDYNPILVSSYINQSKAGHGRYYESAPGRTFSGMVAKLKAYVQTRSAWIDSSILTDNHLIPTKPVISAFSPGLPIDDLTFETGAFQSPSGATFAAMQWRAAEISDPLSAGFNPAEPRKYEITSTWESGILNTYSPTITIPANALKFDRLYRVRVRMLDSSGRWSHWSEPVQFTPGLPTQWDSLVQDLKLTEIMYHPTASLDDQLAGFDEDDFEFLELYNRGDTVLDLTELRFTKGIDFDFADGVITQLAPGEFVLVVRDRSAFERRYGAGLPVAGEYLWATGDERLANSGELLKLSYGAGNALIEFEYDDASPWPTAADGEGYSLELARPLEDDAYGLAASWKASRVLGGSPGSLDTDDYVAWKSANFTQAELLDPAISGDTADPDGDGWDNRSEYMAGTDPRDADSRFEILQGGFLTDAGYHVRFSTVAGRNYQVQYRDALNAGAWSDLPGGAFTAVVNGMGEVVDPTAASTPVRFYRVLVLTE